MYGSAGTYSAGSASIGYTRQISIGAGLHSNSDVGLYGFNLNEIGMGISAESFPWGVFTSMVSVGSGSSIEQAQRVIGTITKSASIGSGSAVNTPVNEYAFSVNSIGLGGTVEQETYILVQSVGIGLGGATEADQTVSGTIDITVQSIGLGGAVETTERTITLEGIPKFTVTPVSGNFQIDIQNRDGKAVKIYRTDQHNTSNQTEIEINADSYDDPIVAGKNYRYKLAFFIDLTPQVIGQKSISKFGKS